MKRIATLNLIFLLVSGFCLSAEAALLIAGNTDGVIREIDTSIPGETLKYNIPFGFTALAVDDIHNVLYASGGGGAWNQLTMFDLTTGAELVAPGDRFLPGYNELYGLEYVSDGSDGGRLFGVGTSGGKAYFIEYDLGGTGWSLPIGIKSATQIREGGREPGLMMGLAYVPEKDRFYSNEANNMFWEINHNTGISTVVFGLALSGTNGLGYQDGLLYGLSAGHSASLVYFDLDNPPHQIQVATNAEVGNGWALTGTTTPILIPEPGLMGLIGAAIAGIFFKRRRRK